MPVVLHESLNAIWQDADIFVICYARPTTYVEATDEFLVGEKAFAVGGVTGEPFDFPQRVRTTEISDGVLAANAVARFWAILDSASELVMATGNLPADRQVIRGNRFQIARFTIKDTLEDPDDLEFDHEADAEARVRLRLPPSLRVLLETGATTLCRCWKVTRTDSVVLGFTDHDHDVTFAGVTFEAASGMTASAIEASSQLDVDTVDVLGALVSDKLSEDLLAAGAYDNAALELYVVNWADTASRWRMLTGAIGEVSRGRTAFRAEMRSLTHAINQERGRVYSKLCDADLGDARCGIDLTDPRFLGTGTVTQVDGGGIFRVSGLNGFEDRWFDNGLFAFTSGQNAGTAIDVHHFTRLTSDALVELWEPQPFTVTVGTTFSVTAGCDKKADTCREKFANIINHRGFEFIPGNDVILRFGSRDDNNDGGSLF